MKVALVGYGKMGKEIEQILLKEGHEIHARIGRGDDIALAAGADIAIEFTRPDTAVANLKALAELQIRTVCGTTGWLEHLDEVSDLFTQHGSALLYASNFSIGVNVVFAINKQLAKALEPFNYTVKIDETHHTEKLDAPSGTAITLAEGVIEHSQYTDYATDEHPRDGALHIASFRESGIKGDHTVTYMGENDTIYLRHEAKSRKGFAQGAVLAARYLQDKQGVYTMKDVLGL